MGIFDDVDPWETSTGTMLPSGNHVVTITEPQDATSGSGNPQIKMILADDKGRTKWDFCSYHENFLSKVAALYDAAGVPRPSDAEVDVSDHCRISKQAIARLDGKKIGAVLRDRVQEQGKNAGKVFPEVQGYVSAEKITPMDLEPTAVSTGGGSAGSSLDDDIPF